MGVAYGQGLHSLFILSATGIYGEQVLTQSFFIESKYGLICGHSSHVEVFVLQKPLPIGH
jgi:hypothetical protein